MAWVDMALLAVLAVSVLVGLMRGLVYEVMSVIGWFIAYFVAQWLTPWVAPHVPVGQAGSALNAAVAFAAAFIGVLVVWSLGSRLVSILIKASPLSPMDRLLGAGFGVVRGCLLLLAVATVVSLTPLAKAGAWQASVGAHWLNEALAGLRPLLPPSLSRHLPG